jgi:mono/diheme cytochrome c family protein
MINSRLLAAGLVLLPAPGFAQSVQNGEVLAIRWCANCHIVEARAASGRADSAPSFPAMAAWPNTTAQSLKANMTGKHGQMPNFSLTDAEEADLAAYILSLRK